MAKVINSKQLDVNAMVTNILSVADGNQYDTANWYAQKHTEIAELCTEFNLSNEQACAMVAVLSPSLRWDKNLLTFTSIVTDYNAGVVGTYMAYGANVVKALRILDGDKPLLVLGGKKVTSFYYNLLHPTRDTGYVTIDRHAVNIALNGLQCGVSGEYVPTPKAYDTFANAYSVAAKQLGLLPQQLQAATWSFVAHKSGF